MGETAGDPVELLTEDVFAKVSGTLVDGLPEGRAERVLAHFRETVLPHRLQEALGEPDAVRRELADLVAEEIIEEFAELAPEEKWRAAQEAWYVARTLPLSDEAFEVARAALGHEQPEAQLCARARQVRARLEALSEEMTRDAPEIARGLNEMVSEAVQDCVSVVADTDAYSLRMGEVIEQQDVEDAPDLFEGPTCPSCGVANAEENVFCSQCGTQIACRECKTPLRAGTRFCGVCGASVAHGRA